MGLDMFVFKKKLPNGQTINDMPDVDFEPQEGEEVIELAYFRKHPDLHGWMESLYRAKDGQDEQFNCVPVTLMPDDLDRLEETVKEDGLQTTTGFFFGESRPEDKQRTLVMIADAREAIANGYHVYYTSWW